MVTSTPTSNNHRHQPCAIRSMSWCRPTPWNWAMWGHPMWMMLRPPMGWKIHRVSWSNTNWGGSGLWSYGKMLLLHLKVSRSSPWLPMIHWCFSADTTKKNVSSMHMSLQFHKSSLMMFADLFSRIVSWSCILFPPKNVVYVTLCHTHTRKLSWNMTRQQKNQPLCSILKASERALTP